MCKILDEQEVKPTSSDEIAEAQRLARKSKPALTLSPNTSPLKGSISGRSQGQDGIS